MIAEPAGSPETEGEQITSAYRSPRDCPRFSSCSAPLYPLDPDWQQRIYRRGEPVCFWVLEAVKEGSDENFRGVGREDLLKPCREFIDTALPRWNPLKKAISRAMCTGARLGRRIGAGK